MIFEKSCLKAQMDSFMKVLHENYNLCVNRETELVVVCEDDLDDYLEKLISRFGLVCSVRENHIFFNREGEHETRFYLAEDEDEDGDDYFDEDKPMTKFHIPINETQFLNAEAPVYMWKKQKQLSTVQKLKLYKTVSSVFPDDLAMLIFSFLY
jgi:hypothetical protein